MVGLTLHLTVRDESPFPLYVIYYALPRPLLAFAAGLSGLMLRRKGKWICRFATILAAVFAVWTLACDWGWHSGTGPEPGRLKVGLWNCQGRPYGWSPETGLPIDWTQTTAEIESFKADIIGLVECGDGLNSKPQSWENRFAGYSVQHEGNGLILLVRGRIHDHGSLDLDGGGKAVWCDVEVDGKHLKCVLIDIASSLWLSRGPAMKKLSAVMASWSNACVLALGDFNMPVDSRHMTAVRKLGYSEAFETAGSGIGPTWPVPLPVHSLDQIWGNSEIRFSRCERKLTVNSDHLPVVAWFDLEGR